MTKTTEQLNKDFYCGEDTPMPKNEKEKCKMCNGQKWCKGKGCTGEPLFITPPLKENCCDRCATYPKELGMPPIGCHNKQCECHIPPPKGLQRGKKGFTEIWEEEFDKRASEWCCRTHRYGADTYLDNEYDCKEIKSFISTLYQQAYKTGIKEGQAKMDNSGRLLFQQGYKQAVEEVGKELWKWFYSETEDIEDAIERITKVKNPREV